MIVPNVGDYLKKSARVVVCGLWSNISKMMETTYPRNLCVLLAG